MTVKELNRDQMTELKETILIERLGLEGREPFMSELTEDSLNESVSDADVFEAFDGVQFTEDDFFCTAGKN